VVSSTVICASMLARITMQPPKPPPVSQESKVFGI
jgi:hypothetical protein